MENIAVKNIDKSFGEKKVLKNLSIEFPAGSRTCIMGPSGCGKTTLLRIMLGLEKADAGCVEGMPQKVSVVFQENRLCEDFSVRRNLELVSEKDPTQLLNELGLGADMEKPVRELSGGMKRRVAIARAVLYDSELIVMDEPFKGLDGELKKRVAETVLESEKTVIFVSHDPAEAKLMGAEIRAMCTNKGVKM